MFWAVCMDIFILICVFVVPLVAYIGFYIISYFGVKLLLLVYNKKFPSAIVNRLSLLVQILASFSIALIWYVIGIKSDWHFIENIRPIYLPVITASILSFFLCTYDLANRQPLKTFIRSFTWLLLNGLIIYYCSSIFSTGSFVYLYMLFLILITVLMRKSIIANLFK